MKKLYHDRNLQIVFGVTLLMVLGVSSILPVFHKMAGDLNITMHQVGLVVTAFTLPGVFLTPIMGVLADRFGRKQVLVPSLLLFSLAGFACAFAPNLHGLAVLRFLQGIGAASLGAMSGTLLGDLYSGPELATATGYNASCLAMGTAIYPAIGGLLGMLGWRWPFILPLLALPLAYVVLFKLETKSVRSSESIAAYFKNTFLLMKTRKASGLFVSSLVTFVLLYGCVITYLPILLGHHMGAAPWQIGLVVTISSLFTGLAASQLGRLTRSIPEEHLIRAAFVLYAAAFAMFPFVDTIWGFIVPVSCFGLAQGLNIPSTMTLLNRIAPTERRAAFMAANATLLRIGQSFGPILMGAAYMAGGIDAVYWLGSTLALGMFAAAFKLIRP